ncbi:MAG: histone deacetylase family protein [Burkholderiaceae bacterium]|jgi:acetoin utilization deacetylase AcuC-like enzyme|nr:histone deacetylase family protein [Burkholderiaceae bacterium]
MGKTGYFIHRDFWKHKMGDGHPECPARLDAIEDRLLISGVADALEHCDQIPLATSEQLCLAHTPEHIEALQVLGQRLVEDAPAGGPDHAMLDPDTSLGPFTLLSARRAAGAGIVAVDKVLSGELSNAFCAVRSPGHHACRQQAMGFCFFNNIAIAVRHATRTHGIERAVVVDFDVHHGNGTEDILAGDPHALMVSFFQHPFYPYCGTENPASNMLNLPVPAYTKGTQVREMIEATWIPRLEAYQPQMVFISAGFDSHREDDMGQLSLNESDFHWITSRICDVANRYAGGRVVSMLEGGYSLSSLARSVEAHLRALADL